MILTEIDVFVLYAGRFTRAHLTTVYVYFVRCTRHLTLAGNTLAHHCVYVCGDVLYACVCLWGCIVCVCVSVGTCCMRVCVCGDVLYACVCLWGRVVCVCVRCIVDIYIYIYIYILLFVLLFLFSGVLSSHLGT